MEGSGIDFGRSEVHVSAAAKVCWICGGRAFDAGDRDGREYSGLQRGEQRASKATGLSGFRPACGNVAKCARRRRAGKLFQWIAAFAVDVSDLRRTQPDAGVDGDLGAGHGECYWRGSTGRGTHGSDQRRRVGDARRSACCGPLVPSERPGPAWRENGDAELWILAAPLRRRPRGDRPQHSGGCGDAGDCGGDAAGVSDGRSAIRSAGADGSRSRSV